MIDHTGINVSDLERSKRFYISALTPLHYTILKELSNAIGFGSTVNPNKSQDPGGDFWISKGVPQTPRTHIAFSAQNRKEVEEFYAQSLAVGGTDNGAPGIRHQYHEHYYAAYVYDPDGYNIEAVYHLPE